MGSPCAWDLRRSEILSPTTDGGAFEEAPAPSLHRSIAASKKGGTGTGAGMAGMVDTSEVFCRDNYHWGSLGELLKEPFGVHPGKGREGLRVAPNSHAASWQTYCPWSKHATLPRFLYRVEAGSFAF